jgi:nucleoside-diphosphate-sugar epimerase
LGIALVTGGAGFIGSHLVRGLLNEGASVRVLDNLSTGSIENLAGLNVELIEDDLRNPEAVETAVAGCEVVFHHAAMISVPLSMDDPSGCYEINCSGSVGLFQAACRAGVRRVVMASSSAVYGEVEGEVSEDTPLNPQSPYASSKLAMEDAAFMFTRAFGLETVAMRYFNVYGPGQSPDSPYAAAIPLFIEAFMQGRAPRVFGDGKQTRSFVHVEDVVRANLLAAAAPGAPGNVYNIAGSGTVSILQLIEELQKLFPDAMEPVFEAPRPGDIRHSIASIDRAAALGYRPEIALQVGLESTIEWFYSTRSVSRGSRSGKDA